jgi:hypothetical protein
MKVQCQRSRRTKDIWMCRSFGAGASWAAYESRKLPLTAAEDLLEIIMRRYERASSLITSNQLCGAQHNWFVVTTVAFFS